MALKDTWVDKVNDIDVIDASTDNQIAQAVIDLEIRADGIDAAIEQIDSQIGNIGTALDEIIEYQETLIATPRSTE